MNRKLVRNIFIILSILTILTVAIIIILNQDKTHYYDEAMPGNSAGNLYNKGYYCEADGLIYFKNMNDEGSLYSMDMNLQNFKKINSDNTSYINVNGPYIFYNRMNLSPKAEYAIFNINHTGCYRSDLKGKSLMNLYTEPTGLISQYGNTVFYQHYNEETGLTLYRVDIDGTNEKMISDTAVVPGCYHNNKMYYSSVDNNHYILCYDIKTSKTSTFLEERTYNPLICGEYIYFMDIDNNYGISRYPLKGGEKEIVINERCATYNISIGGKYIIYQTDGSDNNKLCKKDLKTNEVTTIKDGNFENICVTSNYIFFNKFNSNESYYIENGTNVPKKFNPPVNND